MVAGASTWRPEPTSRDAGCAAVSGDGPGSAETDGAETGGEEAGCEETGVFIPQFYGHTAACATWDDGEEEMARPARIERATPGFGGQYSIH